MATDEQHGVGQRVARARKLAGITQRQLADRAHVSLSLVRSVEQDRVPASPSFVASVSRVLRVAPTHLYGTDGAETLEQPGSDAAAITELRAAMDAYDDPRPEGEPLTLAAIGRQLDTIAAGLHVERHTELAPRLPNLLHHLYTLTDAGHDGESARALLHDAYRMTASIAGQLRQSDLAELASERHIQLAPLTGDPMRIAVSAWHRSTRPLQHGDFRAGLRVLDRARQHLDSSARGRAMAVQLNLRSAVLSARAGDLGEADGWVGEARAIVDEFTPPDRPYYNTDASPLNVAVHHVALPVETYDGGETVRRAASVTVADRTRPERVAHHHIDVARASLLDGNRDATLAHLTAARQAAPRRTRQHPQVHETVRALAQQERRRDGTLAGFARWAGVHI